VQQNLAAIGQAVDTGMQVASVIGTVMSGVGLADAFVAADSLGAVGADAAANTMGATAMGSTVDGTLNLTVNPPTINPITATSPVTTAIANPLATVQDQAVFWSGIKNGAGTAAQWATQNGGVTLEQTLAARGVDLPTWDPSNPASVQAWNKASGNFAAGASGNVTVLQGDTLRVQSIWGQTEFDALTANPNVTSITSVNPTTGARTILWTK